MDKRIAFRIFSTYNLPTTNYSPMPARVESIEAVKAFRAALAKFAETATAALDEAEGEVGRTRRWVEQEQSRFWKNEHRRRAEAVARAKEKVREKTLFKDSTGGKSSAVDERKLLAAAERKLLEAEEKLKAVQRYGRLLQREATVYKGQVQRLSTMLQDGVPTALAKLGNQITLLEKYASGAPESARSTAAPPAEGGMSRGEEALPTEGTEGTEKKEQSPPNRPSPA